jgi:hypothetical protein
MDKIRLDVDELRVQSFATAEGDAKRGTVHAHDAPTDQVECPTCNAAWDTCWDTCAGSCGGSCDCGSGDCSNNCATYDCSGTCYWGCYTGGYISLC